MVGKRKVLESSQPTQNVRSSQPKKLRRSNAIISASRNAPLPKSITVRMRYVGQFALNCAIGSPTFYQFSANGLYDPDITGAGHQPNGFDQMMALYNHYEVLASECMFKVYNSNTLEGFNMGIKLDDSGTLATTGPDTVWETNLMSWKPIASGYTTEPMVKHKYSQKSFFGDKAGDRECWGDASSNPTDQAYFLCIIGPATSTQDLPSLACVAQIDYLVKLHEPKDLVSS